MARKSDGTERVQEKMLCVCAPAVEATTQVIHVIGDMELLCGDNSSDAFHMLGGNMVRIQYRPKSALYVLLCRELTGMFKLPDK